VLDDLMKDIFLGHDLLVEQQVAKVYNGYKIYLGKEWRVSMSWKDSVFTITVKITENWIIAGFPRRECGMQI